MSLYMGKGIQLEEQLGLFHPVPFRIRSWANHTRVDATHLEEKDANKFINNTMSI